MPETQPERHGTALAPLDAVGKPPNRALDILATSLFALRSFVNVTIAVGIFGLIADAQGGRSLRGIVFAIALFAVLTMACLLLPILIATGVAAIDFVRGNPRWRTVAMRVLAACLLCDLFFLGGLESWWIGALIVGFDLLAWSLLAHVSSRYECGARGEAGSAG